jgi:cell division protein FtsN
VSGSPRLRVLVGGVAVLSLVLLFGSRWAGRFVSADRSADRRGSGGAATQAGIAPVLSFYKTLGASAAGGKRTTPPAGDTTLAPSPGDAVRAPGAYVVQVLVTRDEGQAHRLRDRLAAKGLPASVAGGDAEAAPIFRVRVGRWRDRGPAEAVATRLREQEHLDTWVLQEAAP